MAIFINPGTGPCRGATEEEAAKNIPTFVQDVGLDGVTVERYPDNDYHKDYGDGRFCFRLHLDGRYSEIQMPGLPLEQVRFTDEDGQNPWHYPRLYENDSSWLWCLAIECARSALTGEYEE